MSNGRHLLPWCFVVLNIFSEVCKFFSAKISCRIKIELIVALLTLRTCIDIQELSTLFFLTQNYVKIFDSLICMGHYIFALNL